MDIPSTSVEEVGKCRRYILRDKITSAVVKEGIKSRVLARYAKRTFELANREANGYRPTPSRYFVETDIDHPFGAGIYLH